MSIMSIRTKIIISLFFATMLISGATTGFSYWLLQNTLFQEFRNHLRNIAYLGAATIDIPATKRLIVQLQSRPSADHVAQIEHSEDYLLIDKKLKTIRNSEPRLIQYVYILVPTQDANRGQFLVDADVLNFSAKQARGEKINEDISHFGLSYDISIFPVMQKALATQTLTVEEQLSADPHYNTRSLSAYAPLFDEKGQFLGILGVDLKDQDMAAALRQSKIVSIALILISLTFSIILSGFLGHRLTRGIRMLNQVVTRFALKQFEVRSPVISRDEVGNLSKSFNSMAQTIDDYAKYLEALLHAYGRFVPHSFLELLKKDSIIDLRLGDHVQQEMTVLFADIRSFTTLSETMTPKENFDFVNAFLHRVGPIIREHGGIIDKYIGDAVMALFPNSPDNAIAAAIKMQDRVAEYNQERLERGWIPIKIGVGLHTGNLILGTVGEAERMNSTVIADAVNLASRLEAATKYYGVGIIISEKTLEKLPDATAFKTRLLDKVQVKGKNKSVAIYQILETKHKNDSCQLNNSDLLQWKTAMDLYASRHFQEASLVFQNILNHYPNDQPALLYIERVKQLLANGVPQDWQAIEVMQSK
jgi:class 3 adenylate cyclase/HAMP domain-containing protein